MTEKIESMEILPMRGHSRGEWHCSLDDVASSDDEAEYWAIFGVTHRNARAAISNRKHMFRLAHARHADWHLRAKDGIPDD